MKLGKASLLMTVVCIAVFGGTVRGESRVEPRLDNLFQQALAKEFTPGREVIVTHVDVPPNTTLERHWHPGEEFHYCIKGEAELLIDGQPPILEVPGKVAHVPYKKRHTLVTKKKAVTILVFRVHAEGEPVRYLEESGTAGK